MAMTVGYIDHFPRVHAGAGRKFYVSAQGNDANAGTTPQSAWQSITRVNSALFQPGDQLLFHGGARFAGTLQLVMAVDGKG